MRNLSYYLERYKNDDKSVALSGAALTLDAKAGKYFKVTLTGTTAVSVLSLVNGELEEVVISIVDGGKFPLTFTTPVNWFKTDGTTTTSLAASNVTLKSNGQPDFIILWSDDGGTTIYGKVVR